ncbi:unnamed protein product [Moneuplotes crassus]|uniref:Kinesin motor domain-containing protein n=1 Tax=Euplotes crassus TaxID=5936 RepID=A0AAD1XF74_EUPCR|nr:unnamed protein product [Moneuplotes crassus]
METSSQEIEDGVNIATAVRIRPMHAAEVVNELPSSISGCTTSNRVICDMSHNSIYSNSPKVFGYDHVFDEYSSQEEVYTQAVASLVDSFLDGYNSTVFCYGEGGSGKTYTLLGDDCYSSKDQRDTGMIDYCLQQVFNEIVRFEECQLELGYFMICNEKIYDLISSKDEALTGNVKDLSKRWKYEINSIEEVNELIDKGNLKYWKIREKKCATKAHKIFQITLTTKVISAELALIPRTLSLVDMADSSRISKASACGQTLKEAV